MQPSMTTAVHLILVFFMCLSCSLSCTKKRQQDKQAPDAKDTGSVKTTQDSIGYHYNALEVRDNVSCSPDDREWNSVTVNMMIPGGYFIETGSSGYTLLKGSLGDVVWIDSLSKVRLKVESLMQYSKDQPRQVRGITILRGMLSVAVKNTPMRFLVKTPSATAIVKGTRFSVRYSDSTHGTDVTVLEGTVEVVDNRNTHRDSIQITSGKKISGVGGRGNTRIHTLSRERLKEMEKRMSIDTQYGFNPSGKTYGLAKRRRSEQDIRNDLKKTATHAMHGKESLATARHNGVLDTERAQYNNDKAEEKASYDSAKKDIHNTYRTHKEMSYKKVNRKRTQARDELDNEKSEAKEALDQERNKYKSSSESAFDQLHRRGRE